MRVHVALTPDEVGGGEFQGQTVVVIDVFRAATTIATALANGCRLIVPALTPADARARAREFAPGEALLAGERGGEAIAGFDLGNSPLEYTADRVAGKVIILTTSNGTRALARAAGAPAAAVAGLVNAAAIAGWAQRRGGDLTLLCAGENGRVSLEDTVCAGLIVEALAASEREAHLSDAAILARGAGREYRARLDDLRADSRWGRQLTRAGRGGDLTACLALDARPIVPHLSDGRLMAG